MKVKLTSSKKSKKKNKFHVGDIVETPDLKITFISAKKYKCKNQFMQPKKGHIYYRMEFEFENKGDTDQTISSMASWNCYADGYAADAAYAVADDEIDATISPGNKATGLLRNSQELQKDHTGIWNEFLVAG